MTSYPLTQPISVPREYPPAPLVGVAAAIFNPTGEVLLVQRGRPPGKGNWGLPGGLLDLGEKLLDGVRREVREECGVEITIGGLIGLFEPLERDGDGRIRYHYIVLDYWASHHAGVPVAQDDADAVAWVALTDLAQLPMRAETSQVIRDAHQAWADSSLR